MELAMMKLKDPIKITKVGKRMDPPNSLLMRIIILLKWRMETFLLLLLSTRILILTIIGNWNHPLIPLVHKRKGGH
jgi:hypothetical protein